MAGKKLESLVGDEILINRSYLPVEQADTLFSKLLQNIPWQEETLHIYGRSIRVPRLMSWHGDKQAEYRYSGQNHTPLPWTSELKALKHQLESSLSVPFNAVLLNLYRNGTDSMSWHSDDEPELSDFPVIASISLGAARDFQFRHKQDKSRKLSVNLPHGSLLVMQNSCQQNWQHQIPKRKRVFAQRINLTFRYIHRIT